MLKQQRSSSTTLLIFITECNNIKQMKTLREAFTEYRNILNYLNEKNLRWLVSNHASKSVQMKLCARSTFALMLLSHLRAHFSSRTREDISSLGHCSVAVAPPSVCSITHPPPPHPRGQRAFLPLSPAPTRLDLQFHPALF